MSRIAGKSIPIMIPGYAGEPKGIPVKILREKETHFWPAEAT